MTHQTRFFRNVEDGSHKAQCSCGWNMNGNLAECQTRAASHDFDVEVKCPIAGDEFHSGLAP